MRFQSGSSRCGPAALSNALRCLGISVHEDVLAADCGTTAAAGTTEHGLKQAIERRGLTFEEIDERRYALAEARLFATLAAGHPVLLSVESGGHWSTAIGHLGRRAVIVFDGQLHVSNRARNGIHVLQRGDQLRRYWDMVDGKRYGLVVVSE